MDTKAIRAQSQEMRIEGVRTSECSTQTEQTQGVPQAKGRKRKLVEVGEDNSSEEKESDSEDSNHSDRDDRGDSSDSDNDNCVVIAVTYNAPVYNSLFV